MTDSFLDNKELIRQVIDSVSIGIEYLSAVRDEDGNVVDFKFEFINEVARNLVPVKRKLGEELIGKNLLDVIPWIKSTYFPKYVEVLETEGKFEVIDLFPEVSSDTWFHLECRKLDDGIVFSFSDVSERKEMELQMQASHAELKALLDHNPALIFRLDTDLRYMYFNKAFLNRVGYSIEEMQGKKIVDFYKPSDNVDAFINGVNVAISTKQEHVEFTTVERDGRLIYYQTLMLPELNKDGTVRSILNISRDITELKEVEINLKTTKEKYEAIFNHTFHFIAVLDTTGKIKEINKSSLDTTGLELDDVLGEYFWEAPWWISRDDRHLVKTEVMHAFEGSFYRSKIDIDSVNGRITADFSLKPVFDLTGKVNTVMAEGSDISELLKTRKKLKSTDNFLRTLVENIPDGIARVNGDDKIMYVNKLAAKRWHLDYEDYEGTYFNILDIPLEKKRLYSENLKKVRATKNTLSFITKIDNLYTYVVLTPELDEKGNVDSVLAVSRDITELRKHQNALVEINDKLTVVNDKLLQSQQEQQKLMDKLRRSEIEVRTLVDHSPNVILRLSPKLEVEFINKAITTFAEKSVYEFAGHNIESVGWPEKGLEKFLELVIKARDEKRLIREGIELEADANIKYGMFTVLPEMDDFGDVMSLMVIISDLTEQMKSEQQLLLQKERLQEVNADLEAFTYTVSHDLRSPLRAIIGFSEKLRAHAEIDDEGTRFLDVIKYNAKRMGTLIDELLAFSRIGRSEVRKTKTCLKDLFLDALAEQEDLQKYKFTVSIADLPEVWVDKLMIKQVVANLCSNAVKYSLEVDSPTILVDSLQDEKGETVYFIRDNGIGFEQKYSEKIFEVFHRLHNDDKYSGVGVGLAIAKQIVLKHDGRIWAESEPGKGTSIYFTMPSENNNF
ncbi:PAS domain-containing protein [Fulvivirga sediminis]|uniref:histidine kinase n=1 Tax=Fulvivirga sediminis TaxID=2803949 RepID=A0A937K0P0_9BACT|nr:PAS domain-containing protein [Fulvivirga sediminis]MBL3656500.1 PAS domain-containing protein [Fulvivirga sediminis]